MGEMQVQVPDGTPPGGQMQVMTPQGAMMVQVPPDKKPGDMFTFMVPDAPPMGASVAQPMAQGAMMQPVVAQGAVMQPAVMQPVVAQGAVMQPVAAQPLGRLNYETSHPDRPAVQRVGLPLAVRGSIDKVALNVSRSGEVKIDVAAATANGRTTFPPMNIATAAEKCSPAATLANAGSFVLP